jgi:hypothetical protein
MSLTKVSYSMIYGEITNVLDYGADNTGVADSRAAFVAAFATGRNVYAPKGTYKILGNVQIPGLLFLLGDGVNQTIIQSTCNANTVCFTIGQQGAAGVTIGGGIKNLSLVLNTSGSIGIKLISTSQTELENLYIQGSLPTPNTDIGIIISASNTGSYFNTLKNINIQYTDICYKNQTTVADGNSYVTSNTYINCCALTQTTNTNGIGFYFPAKDGEGSTFLNGNIEACKQGILFSNDVANPTDGTSWFGMRFEANTSDIDFSLASNNNAFFGYGNGPSTFGSFIPKNGNMTVRDSRINRVPIWTPFGTYGSTNINVGGTDAFKTNNNTAQNNLVVGYNVTPLFTSGVSNTFIGAVSGAALTSGDSNTALGTNTLSSVVTTSGNTGIGAGAGVSTTGAQNTFLGTIAGLGATTGNNNLVLGYQAGNGTYNLFNLTTESDRIIVGDTRATNAYVNVAWTVVSDARDKTDIQDISYGLDFISKLKPVKFKRDDRSRYENGTSTGDKKDNKFTIGFIAQDVIEAEKFCGATDETLFIADNESPDNLKLKESAIIPALVKAMQELKEEFDAYKASHP